MSLKDILCCVHACPADSQMDILYFILPDF